MIDAVASEPHFLDHIAPVWSALPERGTLWVAEGLDCDLPNSQVGPPPLSTVPTLTASFGDAKKARRAFRPVIYMEHGSGQSYQGVTSGSYVGSSDRDAVILALVPNEQAKARHDAAHPDIPCVVIGSPHLDTLPTPPADGPPAVSFHWDCPLAPETRSAWREYAHHLRPVADAFPGAIGHAHPRLWDRVAKWMARSHLHAVRDFATVCAMAGVYCVDNSSTLFTFAALDRPVVVLNSKRYRRNVHHGGRFWDWADVGVQCDHPAELVDCIRDAYDDRPEVVARRREIAAEVYPHRGDAAQRAVQAIEEVCRVPAA